MKSDIHVISVSSVLFIAPHKSGNVHVEWLGYTSMWENSIRNDETVQRVRCIAGVALDDRKGELFDFSQVGKALSRQVATSGHRHTP